MTFGTQSEAGFEYGVFGGAQGCGDRELSEY